MNSMQMLRFAREWASRFPSDALKRQALTRLGSLCTTLMSLKPGKTRNKSSSKSQGLQNETYKDEEI